MVHAGKQLLHNGNTTANGTLNNTVHMYIYQAIYTAVCICLIVGNQLKTAIK